MLCHSSRVEDAAAFFDRREVVEAYLRTEDVHQGVARRFAAEGLSPALDIGCGDGRLASLLAGSAVRWVGVDLTPAMLAWAPSPRVRGDAARLPLRAGSFGGAAALYMLYRLAESRAAVEEAYRVLRPGGLFAAAAPSRDDASELADLLPPREGATFDSEVAPELIGEVFADLEVDAWDGPYVRLPDEAALRRYLDASGVPAPARRSSPAATPTACRSTSPSGARSSTGASPRAGSGGAGPP
jgi:SAM-dependent methyltransferase